MDQIVLKPEPKTFRCLELGPEIWVRDPQPWSERVTTATILATGPLITMKFPRRG